MSKQNDSWDRPGRNLLQKILPWAAVLLILLVGYQSVDLVKHLLPDYRGQIVTHEKAEENSPLYLQDEDTIAIYPWDEYNESAMIAVSGIVESGNIPEDVQPLWETLLSYDEFMGQNTWFTYLSNITTAVVPEYRVELSPEIYQSVVCDSQSIYVKGVSGINEGSVYKMDLSVDFTGGGLFYHYSREEKAELSLTEINAANEKLQAALDDFRVNSDLRYTLRNAASAAEVDKTLDPGGWGGIVENNPILQAIYRLRWKTPEEFGNSKLIWEYAQSIDNIICSKKAASGENCDILVYQGELLAIFTESDGTRLVLYYDPLTEQISGISLEIAADN